MRAGSPLTDLEDDDEDEASLLKDELQRKEAEIIRIRRELDVVKTRPLLNEARGNRPARFPTPETISCANPCCYSYCFIDLAKFVSGYNVSSPVVAAPGFTHSRLTGHNSASLISNLSQQPTPTPSTPGGEPDTYELPAFKETNPLATPDHSPVASRANAEWQGTSAKVRFLCYDYNIFSTTASGGQPMGHGAFEGKVSTASGRLSEDGKEPRRSRYSYFCATS